MTRQTCWRAILGIIFVVEFPRLRKPAWRVNRGFFGTFITRFLQQFLKLVSFHPQRDTYTPQLES